MDGLGLTFIGYLMVRVRMKGVFFLNRIYDLPFISEYIYLHLDTVWLKNIGLIFLDLVYRMEY